MGRHQYGFVVGLPRTQKKYDSIWVVVDRLTKSAHFISLLSTYSTEDYAKIFIDEILCEEMQKRPPTELMTVRRACDGP